MAYNSDIKKGLLSKHGVIADETLVIVAEWISNIFSPPFVAMIGLALMVITSRSAEVIAWIGVLLGTAAMPTLLLIPLVMWARVKLHRHTVLQTVVGATAGLGFMLFLV